MVPIVMGADKDDYARLAPANSYIHVYDFPSPQKLAEYLIFLDKNDEEYNKFFAWGVTGEFIDTGFFCRMCSMLHSPHVFPKSYTNTEKWFQDWKNGSACRMG